MPATLADIQRKFGGSVYPLYKDEMHEPFMETSSGGYAGVVLVEENTGNVRCELCGNWYKALASHIGRKHHKTSKEYKDEQGLLYSIPLCSKGTSEKLRETAIQRELGKYVQHFKKGHKGFKNNRNGSYRQKIMFKNSKGLCDAQIAARLIIVAEMSNKKVEELNSGILQKFDPQLYYCLHDRYGTWQIAAKALGLSSPGSGAYKRYEDAYILGCLRSWVIKYRKIPSHSEFEKTGNCTKNTILRHFGSWRRAKMMAGLYQLLAEQKTPPVLRVETL